MGEKGSAQVQTPNYQPIATADIAAAKSQADTSAGQLAFEKQAYADQAPTTLAYMKSMMANSDQQSADAKQAQDRYTSIYEPMMDKYNSEAEAYSSPARADQNAGAAMADVASTMDAQRTSALSSLESYGIDPSQTRYGALDLGTRVSQAAATAAAGTQSRLQTEQTGLNLQASAIGMGAGLPGQAATGYGGASASGSSGIGASNATASTYGNLMGTPAQWSGLSNQSNAGATGALGAGSSAEVAKGQLQNQESANTSQGFGQLAGSALTIGALAMM